jgi:hypothetical protein
VGPWIVSRSPDSKSRGDQLCDAVSAEYYGSEASCNDGKKKCGCCGVFHGAALYNEDAPPSVISLATDWGHNLPVGVVRRRFDAGRFGISAAQPDSKDLKWERMLVRRALTGARQGAVSP